MQTIILLIVPKLSHEFAQLYYFIMLYFFYAVVIFGYVSILQM